MRTGHTGVHPRLLAPFCFFSDHARHRHGVVRTHHHLARIVGSRIARKRTTWLGPGIYSLLWKQSVEKHTARYLHQQLGLGAFSIRSEYPDRIGQVESLLDAFFDQLERPRSGFDDLSGVGIPRRKSLMSLSKQNQIVKNQKGSALIEFVLLAPLVILLMMFVLFAGWWSYSKLSSQNAAYSRGVFNPSYATFRSGGEYIPREESAEWVILESSKGMKQMWFDHMSIGWRHGTYRISRIGGAGYVVSILPNKNSFHEWFLDFLSHVGSGNYSSQLPKGNAFFFFTPLISESEY
jgi:hypothetical protein